MAQIHLESASKSYNSELALDSITLSFPENVTTAIVGPSGSGKSTLLQLIIGLVVPDGGQIHVFGEEIDYNRLPQLRRHIGYAVQGTGLFPHLTVEGNITLLARLENWKKSRIKQRATDLMNLVNLPSDYVNRYPHELSGGEQQRVGLCRAMMLQPKIFLLDEAFGALDPITRNEIHEEFLHLQEHEPSTIVLVTHDLKEAIKLAERIVILNQGRIEQIGSSDEIIEYPESDFVESFFQSQMEA